jgi:hypothetical protein
MVSYAGQPIQVGTIRFLIDDRPSALGRIEKGHYRIDVNGGVPVGTGRVEIEGFEETDKVIFVGVGGKTQREARPIVPAKYNRQSTLTTTITAGKVNEVNFELTP